MKIVRFDTNDGRARYGIYEKGEVYEIDGDVYGEFGVSSRAHDPHAINILPPSAPTKIIGIGLNYRDHAAEMGKELPEEPRLFIKPSTALTGHGAVIKYPVHMSSRVDYEGELALIIRKAAKDVSPENAGEYILGYTCLNDVTARDVQAKDIQFTRAKGFDTFAPAGPVIETEIDPSDLEISTYLNGERKQHSRTSELIFGVPELVSFVSRVMTLLPGDIISTGTPSGISPMKTGDMVEVEIEGIGRLTNSVG